jgi:hypothetical protein
LNRITKAAGSVGALAALALGGSALADAASNNSTSTAGTSAPSASAPAAAAPAAPARGPHGRHVGANGKEEQALSSDVAKKVAADHGSPYEAHIRKSDGTEVEVLVNENFEVTAVNAMRGHP